MVDDKDYRDIDPALLPLFYFLNHFTDLGMEYQNSPLAMTITDMKLTLPLDLDIVKNKDNSLTLGGSPPGMYAPISLSPVYHQVKITIALNEEKDTK